MTNICGGVATAVVQAPSPRDGLRAHAVVLAWLPRSELGRPRLLTVFREGRRLRTYAVIGIERFTLANGTRSSVAVLVDTTNQVQLPAAGDAAVLDAEIRCRVAYLRGSEVARSFPATENSFGELVTTRAPCVISRLEESWVRVCAFHGGAQNALFTGPIPPWPEEAIEVDGEVVSMRGLVSPRRLSIYSSQSRVPMTSLFQFASEVQTFAREFAHVQVTGRPRAHGRQVFASVHYAAACMVAARAGSLEVELSPRECVSDDHESVEVFSGFDLLYECLQLAEGEAVQQLRHTLDDTGLDVRTSLNRLLDAARQLAALGVELRRPHMPGCGFRLTRKSSEACRFAQASIEERVAEAEGFLYGIDSHRNWFRVFDEERLADWTVRYGDEFVSRMIGKKVPRRVRARFRTTTRDLNLGGVAELISLKDSDETNTTHETA